MEKRFYYFIEYLTDEPGDAIIWYTDSITTNKRKLFGNRFKSVKLISAQRAMKFLSFIYYKRAVDKESRKTIFQGMLPLEVRKKYLYDEWHIDIEKEEREDEKN